MADKSIVLPDEKRLMQLYRKAVKQGDHRTADLSLAAIRASGKAESVAEEARRIAALANEL